MTDTETAELLGVTLEALRALEALPTFPPVREREALAEFKRRREAAELRAYLESRGACEGAIAAADGLFKRLELFAMFG